MGPHAWLYRAFTDLSTTRSFGMAVGPIPITAIWDYAQRHQLGDLFVLQIQRIDERYLKEINRDGGSKAARH